MDRRSPLACTLFLAALAYGVRAKFNLERSSIQWTACDPSLYLDSRISCAFYEVPLDYHDASAGTASLALAKANATGERLGAVFMNPGGPGDSGIQALNQTLSVLLDQTGGVYDIVSWDPRGVGSLTTPGDVYCFNTSDAQNAFFNGTIELLGIEMTGNFTDPTEIQNLLSAAPTMQQKYDGLGNLCVQTYGNKNLQYVGTAATARDIVSLADAIEGPGSPINYMGYSYGTVLGSWLINMFPERVGRVMMDGVLDPVKFASSDIALSWGQQLSAADDVYKGFFTVCALAGPNACAVTLADQTPLDVNANIQALLQMAYDAAAASSSAPVTSGQIRAMMRYELYFPPNWLDYANDTLRDIALEVQQETGGNVTKSFLSRGLRRRQQQVDASAPYSTEAIICADSHDPTGSNMTDVFNSIISTSMNGSHMFAAAWPFAAYYCPFWPVRAVERYEGPFNKTLANPIIVVGNLYDPATPIAGAAAVAEELGEQATLVQLNAYGHTTLFSANSTCLSDIIRAYMVNGTRPTGNNTVCDVDDDFEVFPGVAYSSILANMPSGDF